MADYQDNSLKFVKQWMIRFQALLFAAGFFGLNVSKVQAATTAECQGHELVWKNIDGDDLLFSDSFLWSVTSPSGQKNYVLGLPHGVPGSAARDWDWMQLLVRKSKVYISEIPLSNADLEALKKSHISATSVYDELGPVFSQKLKKFVQDNNLGSSAVDRQVPWAIYTLLGTFIERGMKGIDQTLYSAALDFKTPILSLESIDELEEHFQKEFARSTHIETIKDTLCNLPAVLDQSRQIMESFVKRDPITHAKVGFGLVSAQGHRSDEFRQKLLIDRNKIFVQKLSAAFREGQAFVALGGLHLPSGSGILNGLKQNGFAIEKVSTDVLKQNILATVDTKIVQDAIQEAGSFLRTYSQFRNVDFSHVPVKVMSQMDLDRMFCGGGNCNIKAFYKNGELMVSVNTLVQLQSQQIAAQGVIVHEMTHHAQYFGTKSHEVVSCTDWKNWEIEALTIQGEYLQALGKVLPPAAAHYGGACREN